MWKIRHYNPQKYRLRYGRYRLFFFVSAALVLLFALGEAALYGAGGKSVILEKVAWRGFFPRFFTWEVLGYLLTFLCGITVYAPFVQLSTAALRGIFSGYLLSCLAASFSQKGSGCLFALLILYLAFSTWIYLGYSSFCTMVALRLYTDGRERSYRGEERRIFGGTLFHSTLFCNTVNLRFLAMYLLLFLCAFLACFGITFLYAFFRSRIG